MHPTVRFVILTAARDKLFASLFGLIAFAVGVAVFLGSGAAAEQGEMAAVYVAGGARTVLVLGLVVFVAFHVERLYDTREIELILSRALSRETFVLSYWLGMGAVGLLLLLPVAAAVVMVSPSKIGALFWAGTVLAECFVILAFALFCALSMQRAIPTIFATLAFYVLARLSSFFLGISLHGKQGGVNQIANPIYEFVAMLLPRFDLAGQTHWLVYGNTSDAIPLMVLVQAAVYAVLLLTAAMFDLRRRDF